MIAKLRRDVYESVFRAIQISSEKELLIAPDGDWKKFLCWKREYNAAVASSLMWMGHIHIRDRVVMDELMHCALKGDLMDHIWAEDGLI